LLTAGQKAAEAIKETRRARELDPFSLVINRNLGQVLFRADRYDEDLKILVPRVEVWTGIAHFLLGEKEEGFRLLDEVYEGHDSEIRIDPAFDVARLRCRFFLTCIRIRVNRSCTKPLSKRE
jgi:hypothetical protein